MNINELIEIFKTKYKKALITGGAGFIGSHIAEELVEAGIEVVSRDDYSAGKTKNHAHLDNYSNFNSVKCDITDMSQLKQHFKGVDIVFHDAASKKNICLHDPRRDLRVNAEGTFNLLELSLNNHVRKFVHASTGSVYGEPKHFPQDENHPLSPVSYYGVSKLAGERYVNLFNHTFGLDTTILRYFHVYGHRQESNEFGGVVSIFTRNMVNGERPVIFGDGTQNRSFTYVKDIVKGNLAVACLEEAEGEAYNLASSISITINDLCLAVIKEFGKEGEVEPIYEDWLVGDIKNFEIDNSHIRSLGIDFEVNFFEVLKDVIKNLKEELL